METLTARYDAVWANVVLCECKHIVDNSTGERERECGVEGDRVGRERWK